MYHSYMSNPLFNTIDRNRRKSTSFLVIGIVCTLLHIPCYVAPLLIHADILVYIS